MAKFIHSMKNSEIHFEISFPYKIPGPNQSTKVILLPKLSYSSTILTNSLYYQMSHG